MIARLGKARFILCAALVLVLIAAVIAVGADGLKLPQATGKSVKKDGKLTVDASNMSEGYIMVKAKKTSKKLRVRVSTAGAKLLYWLNGDGEYEVFPRCRMSSAVSCIRTSTSTIMKIQPASNTRRKCART